MTQTAKTLPSTVSALQAFDRVTVGQRIRVVQRIVTRDKAWLNEVEGEVVSCRPESTGSWFAHGKSDKLWLLRLRIRKADGEIYALNCDQNTQIHQL